MATSGNGHPAFGPMFKARITPPAPSAAPAGPAQQPVSTSTPITPTNTLHYGGTISPKTNALNSKPSATKTFRNQKRYETIIRLENAQIPERAIAAMLTISVPRLRTIKKSPEYLAARMRIMFGVVVDQEASLSMIKEKRKEMLTAMLPPALQVIANAIQAPALTVPERKLQLAAAQDLLDREGTYVKVSRTEVKPVSFFDFEHADKESADIISAIRGIAPPPAQAGTAAPTVTTVINLSQMFSNSNTLSAIDQQRALDELDAEVLLEAEVETDKIQ